MLSAEIRATVGHLPSWKGDPTGKAIDYTGALVAFAVNVTLLDGEFTYDSAGLYLPTPRTRALLVQRASGDGEEGSWSGVSGYIDALHHPQLTDEAFDPVAAAARSELHEEAGIPLEGTSTIDLHLGAVLRSEVVNLALGLSFEETRFNGHGKIRVAPILGMCYGPDLPPILLNPAELSDHAWVPLGEIANRPGLSRGYLENTLPNALGSIGLRPEAVQELLYPQ